MADVLSVNLTWQSSLRFSGRTESGHDLVVDSVGRPGHAGPSPVEVLLVAVAACTGMDVVSILEKMREPLLGLDVEVRGERADNHPKSFTALKITYRVRGRGVSREKVERAVELSQSTYCSVLATLRPDCKVTGAVEIAET